MGASSTGNRATNARSYRSVTTCSCARHHLCDIRRSVRFLCDRPGEGKPPGNDRSVRLRLTDAGQRSYLCSVVTLSKCGPDGPGAVAPSAGVGLVLRCPPGLGADPGVGLSGEVSGPFRAGQVAPGDRAGVLFPGGERGWPGEAGAVAVDDEQGIAAGLRRRGLTISTASRPRSAYRQPMTTGGSAHDPAADEQG
jgi:hypothetical protein